MTSPIDTEQPIPGSPDPVGAHSLAVDLSGTGIAVGLITPSGEIPCSQRIPLGAGGVTGPEGAAAVFEALCAAIDDVLHAGGLDPDDPAGTAGIGVTVAGLHDRESGVVSPDGIPAWRRFTLRERLADRYGRPVRIIADGVAMTIAEHWRGAARGRRNVLGIVAGETLSGGFVLDGSLVSGTTGNAGQIGHLCVDPAGPVCTCGAVGCLQSVAGAAALTSWYALHPGGDWATVPWDRSEAGRRESAAAVRRIAEAAWAGDPLAVAAFRRTGEAIGTAVAGVVTLLDLDVVVVGGALAAAGSVLFTPIADGYRRHAALDYAALPRVVPGVLGADAAMLGAGAVVLRPAEYWPYPG